MKEVTIIGTWLVIDSNRPIGADHNRRSIGTKCIFTEDGYYVIILKEGQKFRTKYYFDLEKRELILKDYKGNISKFSVILMDLLPRRIEITDASGHYDLYEEQ